MKKVNIIKESRDFTRIIKNNKPFKYMDFLVYKENKKSDVYKFGFSVGKKIGNAVVRNKVKRRLKSIIDKRKYKDNFNCVIIARKGIAERSYQELEKNLFFFFFNLGLTKEK